MPNNVVSQTNNSDFSNNMQKVSNSLNFSVLNHDYEHKGTNIDYDNRQTSKKDHKKD